MKKWARGNDSANFDITKYDKFLKKGYKRVGKRIVHVPSEENFVIAWIKRKLPLDPSGYITHA